MRVTNEQLGAVYLEVDGLDKERFKELTKGMEFCSEHSLNYDYIENYYDPNGYQWVGVRYENLEPHSRKITLDELEQLLKPKFTLPEKWYVRGGAELVELFNDLRGKNLLLNNYAGDAIDLYYTLTKESQGFMVDSFYQPEIVYKGYTEITVAQLKEHLSLDTKNNNNNYLKITREALKEIYGEVCEGWQRRIDELLQTNKFGNDFEVSDKLVKEAYKAVSTLIQSEWLEKYLPKPKKIELTHQLRSDGGWCESSNGVLSDVVTYKKAHDVVYEFVRYNCIIAEDKDGNINVYLGYWNSGLTE